MPNGEDYTSGRVTQEEAAELLQCSVSYVRKLQASSKIARFYHGRRAYSTRSSIERYFDKLEAEANAEIMPLPRRRR